MSESKYKVMTGNESCTLGAIAAGMRFFAGYPITPATEIAEYASKYLPKAGGKYIQMEDEIASAGAIIGASCAGVKSMTATSGPGISLMNEHIGYACMAEVPCVFVDVMRQGPCQGVATIPAQGDIMQARWGTQGDHPIIAVAPNSVRESFYETVRAFNLAEKYRTPVFILSDANLAHMSEKVELPKEGELEIINRRRVDCPADEFNPYEDTPGEIAPMTVFGDGYINYYTGTIRNPVGLCEGANNPSRVENRVKFLMSKVEDNKKDIELNEEYMLDDADILVVCIGLVSRSAKEAIKRVRAKGIKAGMLRPITVWPFPEERLAELSEGKKAIVVVEMNEGQLFGLVKQAVCRPLKYVSVTQNNGQMIKSEKIQKALEEV